MINPQGSRNFAHRLKLGGWTLLGVWILGFDPSASAAVDFTRDIAPILSTHCAECHGPNVQKGKVSLTEQAHTLGTSAWKKVITPGNPDASALIETISGDEPSMPKKGPKLAPAEVATLRQWITEGATWPQGFTLKEALHGSSSLWSLQPIQRPPFPEKAPASANPIDLFIEAKLASSRLTPASEADPRTLIRRLTFDLLGLPPTPEEVDAFVAECRADSSSSIPHSALAKLTDRLLSSPHYGERWARHWLDIAHYADTHGFERDQRRDNAWPYRDWVIRAFNSDMPYDLFIRQQLAGDVIAPEDRDAVIATGFLTAGPYDFVGQMETPSPALRRQARADDLDDMVTQVVTSTLGLTINCARCHNHKLDPIPQEDYYRLIACFAGVRRGERELNPPDAPGVIRQRTELTARAGDLTQKIAKLTGEVLNLANVASGGDGRGQGKAGPGFDPNTGKLLASKQGFINGRPNVFHAILGKDGADQYPLLDGVVIPDGRKPVPLTSTGITVTDVPPTSGQAWDAVRHGPVKDQASTKLSDVDYASEGHSLVGLHANAAITFDLQPMRQRLGQGVLRFTSTVGYGGGLPNTRADFHVFVDGKLVARGMKIGKAAGGIPVNVALAPGTRFLTLMATDGGDGIGHDQVMWGDPLLARAEPLETLTPAQRGELAAWQTELDRTNQQLSTLPKPGKLYAAVSEPAPVVKVLSRGNTEAPLQEVTPGTLSCFSMLPPDIGDNSLPEGERRKRLADWFTDRRNPLTARVLVNRLWHHHFGRGLVDTPSDFGNGGGKPSHPELLDWLADEFMRSGWSIKHLQRLMVTSAAYRRASTPPLEAAQNLPPSALHPPPSGSPDSSNRLLARMDPRRLDAESLRDAVLSVSGCLNPTAGGPGYQDFEYQEAYAPIYKHIPADKPELWRRSVYRFIVRTTPQRFLTTLDCPDPANLTPARMTTTTALQSLALMNNEFMLQQAEHFATRIQREAGPGIPAQVERAFSLAFQRKPDFGELKGATTLVREQGLPALCRILFNANEFVHAD